MFFLGLLIGAGVYFLAMFIWCKYDSIGWSILVAIFICIALFNKSVPMGIGMIVAIVVLFGAGYYIANKRVQEQKEKEIKEQNHNLAKNEFYPQFRVQEQKEKEVKEQNYKSHCWNCGHPIDGSWNKKCSNCNTYYICPNCGACRCDYGKNPPFNH